MGLAPDATHVDTKTNLSQPTFIRVGRRDARLAIACFSSCLHTSHMPAAVPYLKYRADWEEGAGFGIVRNKEKAFDWDELARKLPTGKDEASEAARRKLFREVFDVNNNGLVSLAEFDRGIEGLFGREHKLFQAKPALTRAFHAANQLEPATSRGRGGRQHHSGLKKDDYVSLSEFRMLLAYVRQYFELFLMFEAVDTGGLNYTTGNRISTIGASKGDHRITIDEFAAAIPLIERWGSTDGRPPFTVPFADAEFKLIDAE